MFANARVYNSEVRGGPGIVPGAFPPRACPLKSSRCRVLDRTGPKAGAILASIDSFKVGPADLPAGAVCYPGTTPSSVPRQPGTLSKCTAKLPRPGYFCCSGYGVPTGDVDLAEYDFALEFAALRPQVDGARALETFDLWSGLLSYHRSIALHQHAAHVLNAAIKEVSALPKAQQKDAATKSCLPLLANVSRVYEQHLTTLLSFANSQGELGMLDEHESGFAKDGGNFGAAAKLIAMGVAVPPSALPGKEYLGEPRMFVISERTMVDPASETDMNVSVIVLAKEAQLPKSLSLTYRKLGMKTFDSISLARVAQGRGWYTGAVPLIVTTGLGEGDFEYKVQASLVAGTQILYPASGTVVVNVMTSSEW